MVSVHAISALPEPFKEEGVEDLEIDLVNIQPEVALFAYEQATALASQEEKCQEVPTITESEFVQQIQQTVPTIVPVVTNPEELVDTTARCQVMRKKGAPLTKLFK